MYRDGESWWAEEIKFIRLAVQESRVNVECLITDYAQLRQGQRGIDDDDIILALANPLAQIIEGYPRDRVNPISGEVHRGDTRLVCSFDASGRCIHILVDFFAAHWFSVVTCYDPSLEPKKWRENYTVRV